MMTTQIGDYNMVQGMSLKDGGLFNKLVAQRSEADEACNNDPCYGFDVTKCDLDCYETYMEETYYEVLYHGCLTGCAEDYMYCKYVLNCNIP